MESGQLNPELIISEDGSHTLRVNELKEHYHSHKGALSESMHVFIDHGFKAVSVAGELRILEVGFGTGLNALLTVLHAEGKPVYYHALEPFPLDKDLIESLNYPDQLEHSDARQVFQSLHDAPWEQAIQVTHRFVLQKLSIPMQKYRSNVKYHLVYYDAFAPHAQPELWEPDIWKHVYGMLQPGGVLVTYCAKGQVKRDMRAAGFEVERLPGPPGKREMTRAIRP